MEDKYIHIRIDELLKENGISKTRICKDLDLQRGNFNKYCRDDFKRIDASLIISYYTRKADMFQYKCNKQPF